MRKANDPAREGEAVECLLAGDIHGHIISRARVQFFARRGISQHRANLIGPLCFGEMAP